MTRLLAAVICLLAALPVAARPRVASINMCTDQLLLALADRDQIVGVSHLARQPGLSHFWREAADHRILSGKAEDVLPLKPDMVLTATFVRSHTRALLAAQGLQVEEFASAATIQDVKEQIARAGALLDQPARAAAAITRIDVALERLRRTASTARIRLLPLERRGWISGRDSLLTNLLAEAGIGNMGAEVVGDGTRLPLERIVTLKPDALLVSSETPRAEDQGTALLLHPALAHLGRTGRKIVLEDQWTVCAGPMLADALDALAAQISRLSP